MDKEIIEVNRFTTENNSVTTLIPSARPKGGYVEVCEDALVGITMEYVGEDRLLKLCKRSRRKD